MKNRAFTLVETLVVALITVSFLGIIFGVFLVGRNSWAKSAAYIDLQEKTRYAMDKMVREISVAKATEVTLGNCPHADFNCYGQYIEFKMPVVTADPVADTIYHTDGAIKFGVNGHEGWDVKYLVMQGGTNDHRLMRIVPTPPPTGACCINLSCAIKTNEDCLASGGSYEGNNIQCEAVICSGGGGCFLAATPILMADGTAKPIEKIKPGDIVIAFDEETGKLREDKVSVFFEHDADEYLIVNDNLKVTENHLVYSNGTWTEIGKLKIGDMLLNSSGEPEKITTLKKIKETVKVYNLEVNPYHTYIAAGYVVHNKKDPCGDDCLPPPPGPGGPGGVLGSLRDDHIGPLDFLRKFFSGGIVFADEKSILASDIKELRIVNPYSGTSNDIIDITIVAEKKSMLGEILEVELGSRLFLRN